MHRLRLRTLYRGYGSTVLRDLPFGIIQMPLWEYFKLYWTRKVQRRCSPLEGAACGSASGNNSCTRWNNVSWNNEDHYLYIFDIFYFLVAISAAITTPLDVAKTRIMLSSTSAEKEETKIWTMLKEVYRDHGVKGWGLYTFCISQFKSIPIFQRYNVFRLFAGFFPRVTGFTIGGFIFFGVYEQSKEFCISYLS